MRKTEIVTIAFEGRDKGKQFLLTEKPAMRAEKWALRAILVLSHAGADLPEGASSGGMAAFAHEGLKALNRLKFDEAEPLLDEMWECVQVIPDPKNPQIVRPLMLHGVEGDDIEEVTTILLLRERVFNLHTAFFFKER
jgi:hypothetical protein